MSVANDQMLDAFERIKQVVHHSVDGLNPQQLAARPAPDANSIAWLVWHLTRIQDDHISELAGREQAWTADGWANKFALPFSDADTGYGHSNQQVAQVRATAKLLLGYHDAVHARSKQFIKALHDADYSKVIDRSWDPPVTLGVRLVSVISDDLQHAGQAAYVRGLV